MQREKKYVHSYDITAHLQCTYIHSSRWQWYGIGYSESVLSWTDNKLCTCTCILNCTEPIGDGVLSGCICASIWRKSTLVVNFWMLMWLGCVDACLKCIACENLCISIYVWLNLIYDCLAARCNFHMSSTDSGNGLSGYCAVSCIA